MLTSEKLNESSNHGGKQQEETEAGHPQIPDGRVHHHGGSLQCGFELDLVTEDRVDCTPERLHRVQSWSGATGLQIACHADMISTLNRNTAVVMLDVVGLCTPWNKL